MKRQFQNLVFETQSPSHFQLCLSAPNCFCDVSFLGDAWFLFLERDGHTQTQRCASRDEAIGIVAYAFRSFPVPTGF